MPNVLVDGRIPANTECPFRSQCQIASAGVCNHHGKDHPVPFSCAVARGFAMLEDLTPRKEKGL